MKKLLIAVILGMLLGSNLSVNAQASTIKVSGRNIIGTNGDSLRLYGVNYPVYNWGWTTTENFYPEITKTGASVVRIVWYAKSNLPAYSDLKYLDSAISRAIRYKMIPIVTLHDHTCQSIDSLKNFYPFYKSAKFLAIEAKYRQHLILNVANELGFYTWGGSTSALKTKYQNSYISFVDSLRAWGIKAPLMIDAPDGGSNSDVVVSVGNNILQADPLKNILFGVHSYWYSFANNDSTTMATKVAAIHNSGLAFIFGEVASTQDGNTCGQYALKYQATLRILKSYKIGWTAWTWIGDCSSPRAMTTNGTIATLNNWGKFVVNDVTGIKANAKTASQFIALPVVSIPTVKASLITFANVTPTTMTINLKKGNGANRIIIMKQTSAVTGLPVNGTSYSANAGMGLGSTLNAGEYVIYNGSGETVNVTNLTGGMRYYVMVYEYNGSGSNNKYMTSGVTSNRFTFSPEPTTQSSITSFSSVTQTGLTINFNKGNGANRLIIMREASAVTSAPSDGNVYTAKSIFGTGSQTGTGQYVVYTGNTATKAIVTGLTKNTKYYISIFEFNGTSTYINYLTTGFGNSNITSLNKIQGEQFEISTLEEDNSSELINETSNKDLNTIKFYPNPSVDGTVMMESGFNQMATVTVRSMEGKIISNEIYDVFGKRKIELGNQSGIYFITITTDKNTYTQKIIRD